MIDTLIGRMERMLEARKTKPGLIGCSLTVEETQYMVDYLKTQQALRLFLVALCRASPKREVRIDHGQFIENALHYELKLRMDKANEEVVIEVEDKRDAV